MPNRFIPAVIFFGSVLSSIALGEPPDRGRGWDGLTLDSLREIHAAPILSRLPFQWMIIARDEDEDYEDGEDYDEEDYENGEEGEEGEFKLGMHEARKSELEQGLYELRIACYIWNADIDAVSEVSSGDMRLAEALRNLLPFDTSIQHIDFVKEMKIPKNRIIINPEITFRFNNSAIRLSWWWFKEESRVTPSRIYAFGDVIYAVDQDGPNPAGGPNNRIPPDGPPAPLEPPEIDFSAELMDMKLIYEMRVSASKNLEMYVGMAVHWLRYATNGNTAVRVFTSYHDGAIRDRERVTDDQTGDYPLLTISFRLEWRPRDTFYFCTDIQEMYLYYGNYTDLKISAWNQILPFLRIGLGYRIWNAQATLYNLGGNKMNVDVNTVLMGFFVGVYVII